MEKINLSASDVATSLVAGTNLYGFAPARLIAGLGREVRLVGTFAHQQTVRFIAPSAQDVRSLLVGRLRGLPGHVVSQALGNCHSTAERQTVIAASKAAVVAIDAELTRRYEAREQKNTTTAPAAVVVKKEKENKRERYERMRSLAAHGLVAAN